MGTDKALLKLAGKPLIQHAVTKLRRICAGVHILSSSSELAAYGPLVPDIHPDSGPLGGIEAALAHSQYDWNLFLPVDVPFLPTDILRSWMIARLYPAEATRVAMFTEEGRPQPAVCLLHKDIAPSIAAAVALAEFRLIEVLEASAEVLALQRGQTLDQVLGKTSVDNLQHPPAGTTLQRSISRTLWFANLNTPEDFVNAEGNAATLDT
jgi:molybdopterin-guanine dinucleotide biosynthesis protein A